MNQPSMSPGEIRLRGDLQIKESQDEIAVLEDPKRNLFFTINSQEELRIISLLQTDSLAAAFEAQVLPKEQFDELIKRLDDNKLLNFEYDLEDDLKVNYSLFFFRAPLFSPDKWLRRNYKKLRVLVSPLALVCWTAIFVFALLRWAELGDAYMAAGWPLIGENWILSLLAFLPMLLFVMISHEFAHGLILRAYGKKVPHLYFSLVYGIPSILSDMSGLHALSPMRKMQVMLAGPIYQLMLTCFTFIAWSQIDGNLLLSQLLWLFSFASFFSFLINLNPLLKLDGYQILQILLKIDNLQPKSFAYYWHILTFNFSEVFKINWQLSVIYLVYGVLSFLFTLYITMMILGFYLEYIVLSMPALTICIAGLLISWRHLAKANKMQAA